MDLIVQLASSVAVVALTCGALATILGMRVLRERLLQLGAGMVFLTLLLPAVSGQLVSSCRGIPLGLHVAPGSLDGLAVAVIVLGHLVLAVVLVRRRLRGREAARLRKEALDRARLRSRPRLLPSGEERS